MQDKGQAELLLGRPLRALILEDDPWDAELVVATPAAGSPGPEV